jgi:hypothetical protein
MPSIGQTWVLASIGTVVEMDVLSRPTLKRLLHTESTQRVAKRFFQVVYHTRHRYTIELGLVMRSLMMCMYCKYMYMPDISHICIVCCSETNVKNFNPGIRETIDMANLANKM